MPDVNFFAHHITAFQADGIYLDQPIQVSKLTFFNNLPLGLVRLI